MNPRAHRPSARRPGAAAIGLIANFVEKEFGEKAAEDLPRQAEACRRQSEEARAGQMEEEDPEPIPLGRSVCRRLEAKATRATSQLEQTARGVPTRRKKPATGRERRKATREANEAKGKQRDAQRVLAHEKWVKDNELKGKPMKFVPYDLWARMRAIQLDYSGACARYWLTHCTNKIWAGLVRKCALIPDDNNVDLLEWADERARSTVAIGALLHGMQQRASAPSHWIGAERWGSVVSGLCREMILAALQPKPKRRRSLGFLSGTYGKGGAWNRTPDKRGGKHGIGCGIITALEQLGALLRDQNPGQRYATTSGFQPNEYWLTNCTAEYGRDNADTAERSALVANEIALEEAEARNYKPGPFDRYASRGADPPAV